MFDFHKITSTMYTVHKDGIRLTDFPLTKTELINFLIEMPLNARDLMLVERLY